MNILLALNSFKGCGSSRELNNLLMDQLKTLNQNMDLDFITLNISDGGDGFLDSVNWLSDSETLWYSIDDPSGNENVLNVPVLYSKLEGVVFIESAKVLGLSTVHPSALNPLYNSSYGLGELILQLKEDTNISFDNIFIGIGGTATIDMGMGALNAMYLDFLDDDEQPIEMIPYRFGDAKYIKSMLPALDFDITFITDVDNPLLGENGAAKVFGEQKGATPEQIDVLERNLTNIVKLCEAENDELSGAGGGIPAGFKIFYNSNILSSAEFIKQIIRYNISNRVPDILITGEGYFDYQSLSGKAPKVLIDEFMCKNVHVVIFSGKVDREILPSNVDFIELSSFFSSTEESIKKYKEGIKFGAEKLIKIIEERL